MTTIDYHAIAAKLREQNPEPVLNDAPWRYVTLAGARSLADAFDAVGDDKS